MSVIATRVVLPSGYPHQGLPRGIQHWQDQGTVTGDGTGGDVEVTFRFNPESNVNYQPYVSVARAGFTGQVVDPVRPLAVRAESGSFDISVDRTIDFGFTNDPVSTEATIFVGTFNTPTYLGRIRKGSVGQISLKGDQVDTCVYNVWVAGFMADFPFIPRDYWVA